MTYDQLVSSLKSRAEGIANRVRVLEHVAQGTQERLDSRTRLCQIDEEVDRLWQEDVGQVRYDKHGGLSCPGLFVRVVCDGVHSQEARRNESMSKRQ